MQLHDKQPEDFNAFFCANAHEAKSIVDLVASIRARKEGKETVWESRAYASCRREAVDKRNVDSQNQAARPYAAAVVVLTLTASLTLWCSTT